MLRFTIQAVAFFCLPGLAFSADADTFFESRIRPLLAERCVGCHGTKKQEAGLRLDTKTGWERGGDSGKAAVIPGDAANSPLMIRVRDVDPDKRMPHKKDPLSRSEIAALVTWIALGAHDPRTGATISVKADNGAAKRHWAFLPVTDPAIPMKEGMIGEATGLDRFVAAKLAEQPGLKVNAPADRTTLIRRVTFDLTGLPPTPGEIDFFLDDPADDVAAFAKLVDRLLESPAYGERWGRHWLDVARYADTAGDGADYPVREVVKYRDWVVRAFNADLPFDEFVREQIAGDILAKQGPPEHFADRVTATGFLAIGKRYGYAPVPDYQHLDFADAIDSMGRSLLGLSLGCARCHDHKYDPVSMGDYYGLYGIFQSTKWSFPGGEVQKRPSDFPALIAPGEAAKFEADKAAVLAKLDARLAELKGDRASLDGNSFAGGIDLGLEAQSIGKPLGAPWLGQGPQTVLAEAQSPFTHVHPQGTRGIRIGSGQPNEGVRYVFASPVKADAGKPIHFTIDFRTVSPVATEQKGAYRFYLGQGVARSSAVDFSITASEIAIRNGASWEAIRRLEPGKWQTLRLTIDPGAKVVSGVVGEPGDLAEFSGKAIGATWNGVIDTFICDAIGHVAGPAPARDLDNLGLQMDKPFAAPGSGPVKPREAAVPLDLSSKIKELDTAIAEATKSREAAATREWYPVAYGVSEGQPVNAKIQLRGEPEKPGDEVARRFLTLLGGDAVSDPDKGSGRLDLAYWLTRPTNPLTARVMVNRVWQWHFGQGLVTTPSDFGLRGEAPSHPELLDWLTSRFVESGWSVKALHRLMLNSETYRRSSDDEAGNLRIDPGNRWLWRYARRPLDAESIRDAMLAVSGLLDRSIGGPHPFPPVDTWKYTIHNPFHAVYDSDHRSLYLMVQRNRRHPYLALFDAADPNQSVPGRLPTTTPTQSLYLMNSPFVHRNSEAFARRIVESSGDDRERVRFAFVTAQGIAPTESETGDALAFIETYRSRYAIAEKPSGDPDEAAWAALARVLLTGNGFLYVE